MIKINEIWNELESDKNLTTGLLLRRYSADILPNVYIALRYPEKQRCLALQLNLAEKPDLTRFSNLKDIKFDFIADDKQKEFFYLSILLLNPDHQEVFSVFCEDLVMEINNLTNEKKIVQQLLNQLEKWISLFDKASFSGLSPEEQRGLYGELFFMRRWINASGNLLRCVKSWTGPEKQIRDFQLNDWGLEVKTTHGKNHQKVHISSERQLDTTNLKNLFLFHLSLEEQQRNGETLNQIVNYITETLQGDISALRDFRTKLILAGYYHHHTAKYDDLGYQIRNQSYYQIRDTFPRIEESEVRRGVGDVKYSIILSECTNYITDELSVFEIIK
jgi:hypothetical protein